MMKTFATLATACIAAALFSSSCTTRVDPPGEISVETRVTEADKEPGNILANGRIETSGQ